MRYVLIVVVGAVGKVVDAILEKQLHLSVFLLVVPP